MFGLYRESASGSGAFKFKNMINFGPINTSSHYLPLSQALWVPGRVIWSETARYEALMGAS